MSAGGLRKPGLAPRAASSCDVPPFWTVVFGVALLSSVLAAAVSLFGSVKLASVVLVFATVVGVASSRLTAGPGD
jgi:hypothetical protein